MSAICNVLKTIGLFIVCISIHSLDAKLQLRGKSSSIQVGSNATLSIKNPIASFDGTLIKNAGATITGSPITFSNDIFQAINAMNNNLSDLQSVLRQLISIQTKADITAGIFLRTYDTQTVQINGKVQFSPSMLPNENQTVVLEFPQYYESTNIPELIFDNVGIVELPQGSRLIISGIGIVEMIGSTTFVFDGTPIPSSSIRGQDWSALHIEQGAMMHLAADASVTIGGGSQSSNAGSFVLYNNASLLLDNNSKLVLGGVSGNQLMVSVDALSVIQLNHSQAQISIIDSIFDFSFNRQSSFNINNGFVEINTHQVSNDINTQPGFLRSFHFLDGSNLLIHSQGSNNALLRLAPNLSDAAVNFDNAYGCLLGQGEVQFVTFNIDSTLARNESAPITNSRGSLVSTIEGLFNFLTT